LTSFRRNPYIHPPAPAAARMKMISKMIVRLVFFFTVNSF